ncbi:MAG: glutamine synthetase [Myxococcales bacterium SG8_38]|nr:MAG: glutamine synthetase [Myxococcales bacterium SG8_38]
MTEELRREFKERGIRKVKVGGFDIDGVLRGKYISLEKLWSALEKGFGFCDVIFGWDISDQLYDNAKVTGWHTGYPDALARIDASSFRVLPDAPDTANFLVDFYDADGSPHPACPRNLLKTVRDRAYASGFTARFAAEFEFWIFQETPQSLHEKGFRGLDPLSPGMFGYSWLREGQHQILLDDILETCAEYDIEIEGIHTETGPGVWEAALRYEDVLEAADQAALFKTTIKQICARHDLTVTFMAKWNPDLPGSSGHLHQSLWDSRGQINLFAAAGSDNLSNTGLQYLGGLLSLAPELTAFYSPFVNSYKRYVPGVWAPLNASWGIENRTCGARVILGPSDHAARVEFRQTAADINPHVAMAACLGSGLRGIEQRIDPPPMSQGDATAETDPTRALPLTLEAAVERLRGSSAAKEVLTDGFVDHFLRTREWECREYRTTVSEWELRRYFEAV